MSSIDVAGRDEHSGQERDDRRYTEQAAVTLDERNPTEALAVGPRQLTQVSVR